MDSKAGLLLIAMVAWLSADAIAQRPGPGRPAAAGADDDRPGDPPPPPPFPGPPHPIFLAIDADDDGQLSAKEIARAAEAIRTLDTNKDGVVTEDEARPPMPPPPPPRGGGPAGDPRAFVRSFLRFDKDGDGKLTAKELPGRLARAIEQGDTNKDGALQESEIEALARRPPRRPGPPRGDQAPPPPPGGD